MSQVIIDDILPYTQAIATNGQTVFSTDWTANYPSDVVVYLTPNGDDADDASQVLPYPSAYSVAFIGGQQQVEVTLVTGANLGDRVTVTRMTPADRQNLYTNTNFLPSMLNNDFGILTLVDQQAQLVNQLIGPRYNYSSRIVPVVDTILPILGPNQVWVKDPNDTAIIAATISSVSSGTVNLGLQNQMAWYATTGTIVSGLPTAANGVLVTDGSGVPSISTTLPAGLVIPGYGGNVTAGLQNQLTWYAVNGDVVSGLPTANDGLLVTDGSGVPSISSILPSGLTIPGFATSGANSDITSLTGLTGVLQGPTEVQDALGNTILGFESVGVGGNTYVTLLNGIHPGTPYIKSKTSAGANVDLTLIAQGTGNIRLASDTGTIPFSITPSISTNTFNIAFSVPALTGNRIVIIRDLAGTIALLEDAQKQTSTYAVDTGVADAYVIAPSPAITAYADGQRFCMKALNANTGASTVNVNGVGVVSIVTKANAALGANAILANADYDIIYNSTFGAFVLM